MSRIVERNQNPSVGDSINLRFVTYNSNALSNVQSINKVDIYFLDCSNITDDNPDGRILITTITDGITQVSEGQYLLQLATSIPTYTVGQYLDIWNVTFQTNDPDASIVNRFAIYPNLWYTSTIPAVYSFDFRFQPNRIRQGSIKWLIIQIIPNVPKATDLERYYTNLAISADLSISIEQTCGNCIPDPEGDLRLIVDNDAVTVRDKVFGYYQLDTTNLDCGIYDITFTLNYADGREVSPKMQLQIY